MSISESPMPAMIGAPMATHIGSQIDSHSSTHLRPPFGNTENAQLRQLPYNTQGHHLPVLVPYASLTLLEVDSSNPLNLYHVPYPGIYALGRWNGVQSYQRNEGSPPQAPMHPRSGPSEKNPTAPHLSAFPSVELLQSLLDAAARTQERVDEGGRQSTRRLESD